jgi:hypothetical protein
MLPHMSGSDGPVPTPGEPEASSAATDNDGTAQPTGLPERQPTSRVRAGSVIYAIFLLFLIVFAVHAALQHRWSTVVGFILVILVFLAIPTGLNKRLRQAFKGRRPPEPPSGS